MEKKVAYLYVRLIIMMSLITSVTSCKEDDDFGLEEILMQSGWKAAPYNDFLAWGDSEYSYSTEYVTLYFVGNGTGIVKTMTKEFDTYFGEDLSVKPAMFNYKVEGSSVTITDTRVYNSTTYRYEDGSLIDSEGNIAYTKVSISSSEYKWLESAQLYFMPDEKRYDMEFSHGCNVLPSEPLNNQKTYMVMLSLGVDASQKARSRGFTQIRAKYKITNGKFSTTPETILFIDDDNGGEAYSTTYVTTSSEATIEASFYVLDLKNGKEFLIGDVEYIVSDDTAGNEESKEDEEKDGEEEQDEEIDNEIIDSDKYVLTKTYPNRGEVATKYYSGSGTKSNPYIIKTASELRKLADDVQKGMTFRDQFFKLAADITINQNVLTSSGNVNANNSRFEHWKPIGITSDLRFCGTFDGNGHTISGLYIEDHKAFRQGLFGYFSGVLRNLTLKDSYFYTKGLTGIIGRASKYTSGNSTYSPVVENCANHSTITTVRNTGGIVGQIATATIDKCVNYGRITTESWYPCGIVGSVTSTKAIIKNCANYGILVGESTAYGICFGNKFALVSNCVNFGELRGSSRGCGIANYGIIKNCVNYGRISGDGFGIAENSKERGHEITNAYYLETTSRKGYKEGKATNCVSMTEMQMKQQTFVDELNRNARALGSNYSQWKFGKNGFPTLEFID